MSKIRHGGALRAADLGRWNVAGMTGYDDPFGTHQFAGPTDWFIVGATPDRRRLVVQTRSLDGQTRIFYFLGRPGEPHYAGRFTGGQSTVLRVRLPQRQGVVVAALNAALRFRTAGGGWLPAAGDAALLPAAATAVEVRPRQGGGPVTVALP
jgi:hypothetical protein